MSAIRTSIFAALLAGLLLATQSATAGTPATGDVFPSFKGTDLVSGKPLALEDLRGKIVIVDFWATWCGPCVHEMPNVKEVYATYHDRGLEIVSISLDNDVNKCKGFVKENGMSWHHIAEGGGWSTPLAQRFGINSIPRMFVLDANGVIVDDRPRGVNLARAVEAALKKTPPKLDEKVVADNAARALEQADALRDEKKYSEAVEAYEAIQKRYPDSDAARAAARRIDDMRKDKGIAAALQREKQAQDAKKADALLSTARALANAGRKDAAKRNYQKVIDEYPETEQAAAAKKELADL